MKFLASIALAGLLAVSTLAQTLQINTPSNPVECEPLLLTWSGGTGPYFVSILPGGQPSAAALINFGQQSGTSLTWTVNITSGTSLGLNLRDSTGATASSAPFTVQDGGSSCLSGSSAAGSTTSSAAGGSTTSTPATTSSTSTPAAGSTTTTPTTDTTTSKPTSTAPSTTSSSAATTSSAASSGAISNSVSYGVAALVGAAIMAVVA